jgi:hypothetical protein
VTFLRMAAAYRTALTWTITHDRFNVAERKRLNTNAAILMNLHDAHTGDGERGKKHVIGSPTP